MSDLASPLIHTRDATYDGITGSVSNPTITPRIIYDGSTKVFGLGAADVGGGMGGALAPRAMKCYFNNNASILRL